MKNERIVYVRRNNKWKRIQFNKIAIGEDFILCEHNGVPVGHYVAISVPYLNRDNIFTIKEVEITTI